MIKNNKKSSIIVMLTAVLLLLPLSGSAQAISRNKKPATTKTTNKKSATSNTSATKSKQSSSSNKSSKPKKSNKTTPRQSSNSSRPPIYTSNMTQAQKDTIIQQAIGDMVWVEGGTFTMGATAEQGDFLIWPAPTHKVTLSGYYISKYEVTQELWEVVMGNNPSYCIGDARRPVESVSWEDCQKFIQKLNKLTGKSFRLPTEAEWEYAARGGNKSRGYRYSGGNNLDSVAWTYFGTYYPNGMGNAPEIIKNSGGTSHPVGQKVPNELGLYDMSGNVEEWCQDWFDNDYYDSSPSVNPSGPDSGTYRVQRGGSWAFLARALSNRSLGSPSKTKTETEFDTGLRLAATSL